MKHLYILSTIYNSVNYAFEVDSIISDAKNNDVTVLICDGCLGKCNGNTMGFKLLCSECHKRSLKVLESISNITILKTSDYFDKEKKYVTYEYDTIKELNSILYKNIEVGYSVSSYYISLTRNLTPLITPKLKKLMDGWLKVAIQTADIADKVITTDYDMVYIVNGRLFESKAYQEVAFSKGLHVIMGESTTDLHGCHVRMNFDNIRVHSVVGNTQAILEFWNNSKIPLDERRKIASSFFEKRASALPTNDKIYAKGQQKGLLPENWNEKKTNIGIFNSSEDEFAAIGGDFVKNNLFESQFEGIQYLLEKVKDPNIHFYLRVHPNLMNIKYKYHKDLYNLSTKYNNITIIPGSSPISSYSLMYACDKIITFGSTMGAEAAYAKKEAMVMRPCFYYHLGINFVPKTKEEVLDFIYGKIKFEPNFDNVLKFSYYYYNNERSFIKNEECRLNNIIIKLFGRKVTMPYMNLKCSTLRLKYCAYLEFLSIVFSKYFISTKER